MQGVLSASASVGVTLSVVRRSWSLTGSDCAASNTPSTSTGLSPASIKADTSTATTTAQQSISHTAQHIPSITPSTQRLTGGGSAVAVVKKEPRRLTGSFEKVCVPLPNAFEHHASGRTQLRRADTAQLRSAERGQHSAPITTMGGRTESDRVVTFAGWCMLMAVSVLMSPSVWNIRWVYVGGSFNCR